jgi:hypothetical protein
MTKAPDMVVNVEWTTPQMKANLQKLADEAKALADSRVIRTEGERALMIAHQRLIETLLHGEPRTAIPARHHE